MNTICEYTLTEKSREEEHWSDVLARVTAALQCQSQHCLAVRGTTARLYEKFSGSFLVSIEMIPKCDPTVQEHHQQKKSPCTFSWTSYPKRTNLNDGFAGEEKICRQRMNETKHTEVISDCSSNATHQNQMSLVLRWWQKF
jgi:hypothetical protein